MPPLTSRKVDGSSDMQSEVMIIGPQPAIYLAQANLSSVLSEGFMGNSFAAGGQRTATVNVENFPTFPTGILGPELMNGFRKQSLRFWYKHYRRNHLSNRSIYAVHSDTGVKVRRTRSSRRLTRSSSLPVLARKRLGLKGEEAYWQSGIGACTVCDGAVLIFRNKPLAVIGSGDSAAEEATCTPCS
ncbi:hypothetical protein K435DRAFT_870614 [Dendrothele bispora CBS 962.96]|uniref:Uncharacterized protein n=1 Tax=Dendrothele bispora (strain CBS 962.96) TaxID=1314807 RepID=A0A4S8L640_DENBC|nr:hypothetical protein K435DRAFT_870614 [Dendrothele bispora CBS 962.96]